MERQRSESTTTRGRGREPAAVREETALVARYERLLAALERAAAMRERTGLATRLGREQLRRPGRT